MFPLLTISDRECIFLGAFLTFGIFSCSLAIVFASSLFSYRESRNDLQWRSFFLAAFSFSFGKAGFELLEHYGAAHSLFSPFTKKSCSVWTWSFVRGITPRPKSKLARPVPVKMSIVKSRDKFLYAGPYSFNATSLFTFKLCRINLQDQHGGTTKRIWLTNWRC